MTGIDPNPYMFEYAKQSAKLAGLPADALHLKLGAAESIPAKDASFDTVICTLVSSILQAWNIGLYSLLGPQGICSQHEKAILVPRTMLTESLQPSQHCREQHAAI